MPVYVTFLSPVLVCKIACNYRTGSNCSFYMVRPGMCMLTWLDQVKNTGLELVYLHLIFGGHVFQITPFIMNGPMRMFWASAHMRTFLYLIYIQSPFSRTLHFWKREEWTPPPLVKVEGAAAVL